MNFVLGDHVLDLILLLLVVLFAVSGYRQGFIVSLLSFAGFIGGGVVGVLVAPPIAETVVDGTAQQALLAIIIAFLSATIGQLAASSLGAVLRNRVTGNNARAADAVGGALVSTLSLLIVAWFFGTMLSGAKIEWLRTQVNASAVLEGVDTVMPERSRTWFSSFQQFVDSSEFPRVFYGLGGESVVEVPPPNENVRNSPALAVARRSIFKLVGTAPECQRKIEGTGFVYSPERIMTNAHVVAGVRGPIDVISYDGRRLGRGRVVLYDPRRDIAVLYVPGLTARPLEFGGPARTRDDAIVAGFPKGHGFTADAARVRAHLKATGPDIYHSGEVVREIYAIRGKVEPGNSGGPLLAPDGTVYGVIFAAALGSPSTGYALTAEEVEPDAVTGRTATVPVGTGACSD
ncbi:Colicin V production protein [Thermomonospora curvata DSM 43183]|uniref:Colicin V production protein n=1 Tax=Thermomonospora curvata (strain ATCC 19995 / DSM 43183 / JCM 3096 / KCTC 9072 / NBRC 15933 / NCIMB 10081 / Henssen B9) TaxID=471852 RepID=D1A849_THECD|nr:Colicin V production protein [Thermomonospora curvata DSM 43183]